MWTSLDPARGIVRHGSASMIIPASPQQLLSQFPPKREARHLLSGTGTGPHQECAHLGSGAIHNVSTFRNGTVNWWPGIVGRDYTGPCAFWRRREYASRRLTLRWADVKARHVSAAGQSFGMRSIATLASPKWHMRRGDAEPEKHPVIGHGVSRSHGWRQMQLAPARQTLSSAAPWMMLASLPRMVAGRVCG